MPVGDNQFTFTCVKCKIKRDRDERCPYSGACEECCDRDGSCIGSCSTCTSANPSSIVKLTYHKSKSDRLCNDCGRHVGCCLPTASCLCSPCVMCGNRRRTEYMYFAGHPCRDCHATRPELESCKHCSHGGCTSNEVRRCCKRCDYHCRLALCKQKVSVTWFDLPLGVEGPVAVKSKLGHFRFNPSARTIGLEIECSSYRFGDDVTAAVKCLGGGIVQDGSVSEGFEINTPPMNGDAFVYGMQGIAMALESAEAKSNQKSSVHVHIGCRDLSAWDMRKVVMLYGRLESGLYSIIDPKRLSGSYSRPCGGQALVDALIDSEDPRSDLFNMTYGERPSQKTARYGEGKGPGNGAARYWGLNLHSWYHRGTIEFRAHHGTRRWEKLVGWSMLLCAIVDKANASSVDTVANWPQGLTGLKMVAPTPWVKAWVNERWAKFAAKRKDKTKPIVEF